MGDQCDRVLRRDSVRARTTVKERVRRRGERDDVAVERGLRSRNRSHDARAATRQLVLRRPAHGMATLRASRHLTRRGVHRRPVAHLADLSWRPREAARGRCIRLGGDARRVAACTSVDCVDWLRRRGPRRGRRRTSRREEHERSEALRGKSHGSGRHGRLLEHGTRHGASGSFSPQFSATQMSHCVPTMAEMSACPTTRAPMHARARACVCACACVRASARACVRARARAYLFLAGPFDKCAIASPSPSSVR
jgi:hypothetical protein